MLGAADSDLLRVTYWPKMSHVQKCFEEVQVPRKQGIMAHVVTCPWVWHLLVKEHIRTCASGTVLQGAVSGTVNPGPGSLQEATILVST